MEIRKIPTHLIKPAAYNPRKDLKPGDPEYEKIKMSIANFGYVEPIVWNMRTGNLIAGHQRFKVLLEENPKEIEVSVVDLPPEREKALNIALNKIRGDWDYEKLSTLLEELVQLPDFDVNTTGFDLDEISQILDREADFEENDFDWASAINNLEEPITRRGELIELGPHRLLCGDSADPRDMEKLMNGQKANLLVTDPPYGISYENNRPNRKGSFKFRKWQKICGDELSPREYEKWLTKVLANVEIYLQPGSPIYIFNSFKQFDLMGRILTRLNFHIECVITWAKPSFAISYADYNQQTEFILYGWKKGRKGGHFWYGPANETTLWEIKRELPKELIHPTQKPVELFARAIQNSSKRGDTVIDLFLGSGSTLIAADGLGRRCLGLEIDPKFCDAIVKRYFSYRERQRVLKEDMNYKEVSL